MHREKYVSFITVAGFAVISATSPVTAADPAFSRQNDSAGLLAIHSTPNFLLADYAGGATVGDFNNDGWQDIFVLVGGFNERPDKLFINNGDGTFTDQAEAWGVDLAHRGKGAATGDFNGDGWLDMYVYSAGPVSGPAGSGHHILYRNTGEGAFTDVAASAGVQNVNPDAEDTWTACFGDFDLDGDLDLYVGGFQSGNSNNNGNRLFENNGDETFTDITDEIGLFAGVPPVANLSASFADMDGDHYPELLLGGDFKNTGGFGGSRYFQNNNGVDFTDTTDASNVGHEENGMGQCLGDVDNDGDLDWYVTSIFTSPTFWTGNKLYLNNGSHQYDEVAALANVADGGYGWGAVAVDFNHDGWLDIAETNGDDGDAFGNEQTYLWINNGKNFYNEMALEAGIEHFGPGRTLINFDYDNDGDQDLIVTTNGGAMHLYRNDLDHDQSDTNWLRVFLDTQGWDELAPHGFGAKVTVTADGQQYMRAITGGVSYLGVSELSAPFGLTEHTTIDELQISWPDGSKTVLTDLDVNQMLTINPDGIMEDKVSCPADLDGGDTVDVSDLLQLLSAWGPCGCAEDLDGSGAVDVADLLELLSAWGPCD